MRATFYRNIKTLSGKDIPGNMVFNSYKDDTICIVRRYVYPTLTDNNELAGAKVRAAAALWKLAHANFVRDLGVYARAYNSQILNSKSLYLSAYNVFMMGVLKHPAPITTIAQLKTQIGESVDDWISMYSLPKVNLSVALTANIAP